MVTPAGRRPIAVVYNPKDYMDWKADAAKRAKLQFSGDPFEVPVEVSLLLVAPRPKTTKLPVPKPDTDNYAKGTLDALTDAEVVWPDDWLVADLIARKRWAAADRPAGITITIRPLEDWEL